MIDTVFQLGEAVEHRGIVVTPLFPRRDPVTAYITLDEAVPHGLRVTETSASGSVPELALHNPLEENVLLYDGEELVGAKQNRILNVSVLCAAKASLTIPVSCVEEGRWRDMSASFAVAPHNAHPELRRRKAEALAGELKPFGIRVLIVEPGPFRTDFLGRSITMAAKEMRDYAASSRRHYRETNDGNQAGDPDKAVAVILRARPTSRPSGLGPTSPSAATAATCRPQQEPKDGVRDA